MMKILIDEWLPQQGQLFFTREYVGFAGDVGEEPFFTLFDRQLKDDLILINVVCSLERFRFLPMGHFMLVWKGI